jgi:hypothetical protein
MKSVIISFDYELFFGDEPGTVQKSLLEPTAMLMEAMEYAGAKATFFVDYLMLKYMLAENEVTKSEANLIIEQLKEMVSRGHRIELHLHPHWVDAKYINGKWDFSDFSHYCLNSFSQEEITRLFVEGTNFLEAIAQEVEPDYKIIAFRAGGWAILPFELMKDGFEKAGIKVDSSVMQGSVIYANDMMIDFSQAPTECVYTFEDEVLKKKPNGSFIEAQISSFCFNIPTSLLAIHYVKKHPERFKCLTDGSHKRRNAKPVPQPRLNKWQYMHRRQVFGLGGLPSFLLNYEIRRSDASYLVIISHPKDIMPITCDNIRGMKDKFYFCTYKCLCK